MPVSAQADSVSDSEEFTSLSMSNDYIIYSSHVDPNFYSGMVLYFHGDGAFEFDNPRSEYAIGGENGLLKKAEENNLILVLIKTPDSRGTPTWWESGELNSRHIAEFIESEIYTNYLIDKENIWLVGYSGGAQFISRFFLPAYSSMLEGGGAVLFAGGGTPKVPIRQFSNDLQSNFNMHWYTGALDNGTACAGHRYDALSDAVDGYSSYTESTNFNTSIETPAGLCHDVSELIGQVFEDQYLTTR